MNDLLKLALKHLSLALSILMIMLGCHSQPSATLSLGQAAHGLMLNDGLRIYSAATELGFNFRLLARAQDLNMVKAVEILLYSPAGPLRYLFSLEEALAGIRVGYARAGRCYYQINLLDAESQNLYTYESYLDKAPLNAISPLDLKVGARSLRVASEGISALVMHPLDIDGNVSHDEIHVLIEQPGGNILEKDIHAERLVAWTYLPSDDHTGLMNITAYTAQARGERNEVDILPNVVNDFILSKLNDPISTSPRQTWQLAFEAFEDVLANPLESYATLSIQAQSEFQQAMSPWYLSLNRPIIDNHFSLSIPSAPYAGSYQLKAYAGRSFRESNLSSHPHIPLIPWRWLSLDPAMLEVGPIIDTQGALVDDGTSLTLELLKESPAFQQQSAPRLTVNLTLNQGMALWQVPKVGASYLRLRLLDHERILFLPSAQNPLKLAP
ncbi:MAG: hypothetical protein R2880_18490 [Deinococcales bacterium]